jgi:hypothetical protein
MLEGRQALEHANRESSEPIVVEIPAFAHQ